MRLSQAIEELNAVTAEIERLEDEGVEDMGDYTALALPLKNAVEGLKEAVDRRVSLLKALQGQREEMLALARKFQRKAQRFDASIEQIRAATVAEIEANPMLEFRGHVYAVTAQSSSRASVKYLDIAEPQQVKRVVPESALSLYPQGWLEPVTLYTVKTGFEDAIRNGAVKCDAAHVLPKTKYLRLF